MMNQSLVHALDLQEALMTYSSGGSVLGSCSLHSHANREAHSDTDAVCLTETAK